MLQTRAPARFPRVRAVGVARLSCRHSDRAGRGRGRGSWGAASLGGGDGACVCVGGGGYAGRVPGVTWCAARRVLLSVGPGAAQPERGCEVSSRRGAGRRSRLAGAGSGRVRPGPRRARAVRAGTVTDATAASVPCLAPLPAWPRSPSREGGPGTAVESVAGVLAAPNPQGCLRE